VELHVVALEAVGVGHLLHQPQIAAAREPIAFATDHHHPGLVVGIDIAPHIGQLAVQALVGGGQLAAGVLGAHDQLQDALRMAADAQGPVAGIVLGIGVCFAHVLSPSGVAGRPGFRAL